ncbi:MAG: hypothetical protein Q9170_008029 [Blastenia crenularia]
MSDPEGDSRMQSSSEGSEDDLDAMFPRANEPPNTTHIPQSSHLHNLQQFSGLSPPSSEAADSQNLGHEPMEQANSAEVPDTSDTFVGDMNAPHQMLSIADREPGASWNTRKQKDEEDRVKEHLLDKGFSLSTLVRA